MAPNAKIVVKEEGVMEVEEPEHDAEQHSSASKQHFRRLETVEATSRSAPTAAPAHPRLEMLVDRSSFDETESYGVDRQKLETSFDTEKLNSSQSTVLKNGKIRRRMRWRPKRHKKNPLALGNDPNNPAASAIFRGKSKMRQQQQQQKRRQQPRHFSSNASVGSAGESSKASTKSMHSFASTQTMKKDNTAANAKASKKFPLPRPNYPNTLEGNGGNNGALGTINNQGTASFSSANKNHGEQHTVDLDDGHRIVEEDEGEGDSSASSSFEGDDEGESDAEAGSKRLNPSASGNGMPPLFQQRIQQSNSHKSATAASTSLRSVDDDDTDVEQPPVPPRKLKHHSSTPPESAAPSSKTAGSALSTGQFQQAQRTRSASARPEKHLPSLSTNDLLSERRVDLRIPGTNSGSRPPTPQNGAAGSGAATLEVLTTSPTSSDEEEEEENAFSAKIQPQQSDRSNHTNPVEDERQLAGAASNKSLPRTPSHVSGSGTGNEVGGGELRFSMSDSRALLTTSSSSTLPVAKPVWAASTTIAISAPSQDVDLPRPPPTALSGEEAVQKAAAVPDEPIVLTPSRENQEEQASSSPRASVPIDLDDGTFLDAEKNLAAIHEIGIEHLRHGEYSEALEVFEEILRGQLTRYGQDHVRVGTALHNIGLVHMKRGDFSEAARVCREAVRVRRVVASQAHSPEQYNIDLAVSLSQLGVAYLELSKFKKAIHNFRLALRIRRRVFGSQHAKVAKLLNNIGCALYELTELEVAKVAFEEALDIQRETLRSMSQHNHGTGDKESPLSPSNPLDDDGDVDTVNQVLLSIASTLCNIGSIKLYWGHFEEASIDLEEALLIQQSVLGDDHPLSRRTVESLDWIEQTREKMATEASDLSTTHQPSEAQQSADANEQSDSNTREVESGGSAMERAEAAPEVVADAADPHQQETKSLFGTLGLLCSPVLPGSTENAGGGAAAVSPASQVFQDALGAMEKNIMLLKAGFETACNSNNAQPQGLGEEDVWGQQYISRRASTSSRQSHESGEEEKKMASSSGESEGVSSTERKHKRRRRRRRRTRRSKSGDSSEAESSGLLEGQAMI